MGEEIKFKQEENIQYIKTKLGCEQWVCVAGSLKLHDADAAFWSCLISPDEVSRVLTDHGWDIHYSSGFPGFIIDSSGTHYERNVDSDYGIENIVFYRDFYGVKKEYFEVSEEFRFLFNLFKDAQNRTYTSIKGNGETEDVIRVDDDIVFIRLDYLHRYAAAKQKCILLFFDIRMRYPEGIEHYGFQTFNSEEQDDNLFFRIWGDELYPDKEAYSVLMGKKVLFPRSIETCGLWPYESEREYEDYIIGLEEDGTQKVFTSDPKQLSSGSARALGAPEYLTPVYFSKDVLQKYYDNPELYDVDDGYLRCKNLWGIRIDNDHDNYVVVMLGDLGRDLPAEEQSYWKHFNIVSEEGLSESMFLRSFGGFFANAKTADLVFKQKYRLLQTYWADTYGWNLLLYPDSRDDYLLKSIRIPLTDTQMEFDQLVMAIEKLLVDSINVEALGVETEKDGSINKLEAWFVEQGIDGYEPHIKFLRDLRALRSSGSGHRKGEKYSKISKRFGIGIKPNNVVFSKVLQSACELVDFLFEIRIHG